MFTEKLNVVLQDEQGKSSEISINFVQKKKKKKKKKIEREKKNETKPN